MKKLLGLFAVLILFSVGASAQGFFKPLAKPTNELKFRATSQPIVQNSFRPVVGVNASVSDGTQLTAGVGVAWQHNVYDDGSQTYLTKYSVGALAFLGTNGSQITGTAGLVIAIPGTNGLLTAGPGYDWTNKKVVILTGVQFNFN